MAPPACSGSAGWPVVGVNAISAKTGQVCSLVVGEMQLVSGFSGKTSDMQAIGKIERPFGRWVLLSGSHEGAAMVFFFPTCRLINFQNPEHWQ